MSEQVTEQELAINHRFANAIVALTGTMGRCSTRDLTTISLSSPERLKLVGNLMEVARKHHHSLLQTYENKTKQITWTIDDRDLRNIQVFTSVGMFSFSDEQHDPRAQRNQRYW